MVHGHCVLRREEKTVEEGCSRCRAKALRRVEGFGEARWVRESVGDKGLRKKLKALT